MLNVNNNLNNVTFQRNSLARRVLNNTLPPNTKNFLNQTIKHRNITNEKEANAIFDKAIKANFTIRNIPKMIYNAFQNWGDRFFRPY